MFESAATLIGHRGLGKGVVLGHQENSLDSFPAAVQCGLTWVEVDVRRTRDDELVVAHDPALHDGTALSDVLADEAEERGLLRLSDLLEALPTSAGVLFDIKSAMADALRPPQSTTASLLAPVAARESRRRPVVATSFDAAAVQQVRAAAPRLPIGLLTWLHHPVELAVAAAAHLDVQMLSLHAGSLWPNRSGKPCHLLPLEHVLAVVHDSGRELLVWCPTDEQARQLTAVGVDALIFDDVPRRLPEVADRTADGGR